MKATEILGKLKDVLLSTEEVVTETPIEEVKEELSAEEVVENVELESQEEVVEEVVEETTELAEEDEVVEEVVEGEAPVMEYASKQDLEDLKKEFMGVIEGLMKKEEEYNKEVPAELSAEEPVEEISHSPEAGIESKSKFVIGGNRAMTTKDRVFAKMFNK
jgi:deoxyribodipyrimidine photolyase